MEQSYDLVILGGGIAGMTAAIYAARARLRVLILEKSICGGLVNSTYRVENFPSYPGIGGMDLMEKVRDHVDGLGVDVREVVEMQAVDLAGPVKRVETDEGVFAAPAVILATGRTPKKLPLDIECEQVHYCAICDGSAYQGKKVLVVGGGNSGVEESLYLKGLGVSGIVLVEEMDRLLASEKSCRELAACDDVEILTSTCVRDLVVEDRLKTVVLHNSAEGWTVEKEVDGVFVYIGQEPQTELLKGSVRLDESGYIIADETMGTGVPGVFAAGDVVRKKFRQITTAMSDGTIAALSAIEYLRNRAACPAQDSPA